MKIYDCFLFNDENHILEVRINELKDFVDYFIIIEFGENHQGKKKGKKINKEILEKFKKKIRYYYFESFNKKLTVWEKENFQRNKINDGIFDAAPNDVIIVSDVDEIPILKNIDFSKINNQVFAFSQINSIYKLNLYREQVEWTGSKLCLKKYLKSPQWLRSLKVHKKYNFLRIDKLLSKNYYRKFKIIKNGGWHFGWIRNIDEIINKLDSFAHTEFNNSKFKNYKYITECINKNKNFLDTKEILEKIDINLLPKYLVSNKDKFKDYLK
jgi:beta-1,4-mannosyl-glycoprotein beta-1,4-N-acetylglucosaminyltransferase